MKLSAVIIALNESERIESCLRTLSFCDEIVVVDSGSADATREIALKYTDKVISREFDNFAAQKNFAVSQASHDWILSVDADEHVSRELALEVGDAVRSGNKYSQYRISRNNIIFGHHMRFGGSGDDYPIRLFRKSDGEFKGAVHETWFSDGELGCLKSPLVHYSTPDMKVYLKKLIHYCALEAVKIHTRNRLFLLGLKPVLKFLRQYVLKLGFLDGRAGFVFAVMSAYYDFVSGSLSVEGCMNGKS